MEQENLKYRIWDIKAKEFVDINEWNSNYVLGADGKLYDNDYDDGLSLMHKTRRNRFIILLYSGLKDSKGVEVYEGDVLASIDGLGNPQRRVVEYKSYGFEHDDEGIGFDIGHNIKTKISNELVIGNIYQNPELLMPL